MQDLSCNPFRLRDRLREKLDASLEAIPLFNVLLIAVLLMLTGSRFIFAPGVSVPLSAGAASAAPAPAGTPQFVLPSAGTPLAGADTSAVLTVKSDTMFIFGEHIYETPEQVFEEMRAAGTPGGTLLLKLNRSVSVQGLFRIAELAGLAGFDALQIAGESPSLKAESVR